MIAKTALKILLQLESEKPAERQFAADIIEFANQTPLQMTRLVLQELPLDSTDAFRICKFIKAQEWAAEVLPDMLACYELHSWGIIRLMLMDTLIEVGGDKSFVIDFALRQLSPNTRLSLNEISIMQEIMKDLIQPQLKHLDTKLVLQHLIPIYEVNDRELAPIALEILSQMGTAAAFLIPEWVKELKYLAENYSAYGSALVKAMSPKYLVKALLQFGTDEAIEGVIAALYLAKEASRSNLNSHEIVDIIRAELQSLDDGLLCILRQKVHLKLFEW